MDAVLDESADSPTDKNLSILQGTENWYFPTDVRPLKKSHIFETWKWNESFIILNIYFLVFRSQMFFYIPEKEKYSSWKRELNYLFFIPLLQNWYNSPLGTGII